MTPRTKHEAPDGRQNGRPADAALSCAAMAAAASAVLAWAACCVLPMSLALAGLGLGGLGWIAGQRVWLTLLALGVIGVGWIVTWRRARMCRIDSTCAAPSRLGASLLGVATILAVLALLWQPIIEPWALTLIRNAR